MAIRNINTIQNPNDLAYILSYSNRYMYESLANLGQRYSVKGDSIQSNYFTTLSVCNKSNDDFVDVNGDIMKLISKLSVIDNNLYLQFFELTDISKLLYSEKLEYTINNLITTDAPLKLNTKINGIDYYRENLYIFINESENALYIASLGCDNDMGIVELNIESYNINTNTLVKSLKLIDTNDSEHYYIYYLYDEIKDTNDTDTDYVVYKYYINKSTIDTLYNNFNSFALSIYQSTVKEYYSEYKTLNIDDIFNEILQVGFINALPNENNLPIPVSYNKELNGFYVDSEEGNELNSILAFFYNQYIYMYNYIFEYYCNYVYKSNNNQLNKYILYKIFNKAYIDSNIDDISNFEMYIPIDYEFNYYSKDVDSFYIYSNESPINVFYTINTINQDYIDKLYGENSISNTNSILLVPHKSLEKVILYKFVVNYNTSNNEIINNISVSNLYSTPYILDDYWVINDVKTPYKAVGDDANNPNIILVYTKNVSLKNSNYTNNDFEVLTSINSDLLNSISWKRETICSNLFENIDTSDKELISSTEYYSYVLIPSNITSDKSTLVNQLKGSLIINLSDINNVITNDKIVTSNISEKDQIKEVLGNNSFITSFWVFDNYSYSFNYIRNPSNTNNALTLANLSNINNIIANQTKSEISKQLNNFDLSDTKFTYAVFNTSYNVTKSVLSDISYSYAVLYNKNINDLNLSAWETTTNTFNNPLIFELKYIDSLSKNGIANTKQYIMPSDSNGLHIESNNILSIYKLYNSSVGDSDYEKYTYEFTPSFNTPLFNLSEVFLYNVNSLNKTNICVLDKTGNIYYSYIGGDCTENDKSILHLGTSNINQSIGTDSLLNKNLIDKFKTHDGISIDFNKIYLNCYTAYFPNSIVNDITDEIKSVNLKFNYNVDADNFVSLYIYSFDSNENYILSEPTGDTNIKIVKTYITSKQIPDYENHVIIPISYITNKLQLDVPYNCNYTSNMDIITFVNDIKYLFTESDKIFNNYFIDLTVNYEIKNNVISNIEILNNKHKDTNLPCRITYKNNI